jgi:hypothetical protein
MRRPGPKPQAILARGGCVSWHQEDDMMAAFVLWCILLVLCWPVALLAIVLYPIVWVVLLPFRLLGVAVSGVLELLRALVMLPARILGGRPS